MRYTIEQNDGKGTFSEEKLHSVAIAVEDFAFSQGIISATTRNFQPVNTRLQDESLLVGFEQILEGTDGKTIVKLEAVASRGGKEQLTFAGLNGRHSTPLKDQHIMLVAVGYCPQIPEFQSEKSYTLQVDNMSISGATSSFMLSYYLGQDSTMRVRVFDIIGGLDITGFDKTYGLKVSPPDDSEWPKFCLTQKTAEQFDAEKALTLLASIGRQELHFANDSDTTDEALRKLSTVIENPPRLLFPRHRNG